MTSNTNQAATDPQSMTTPANAPFDPEQLDRFAFAILASAQEVNPRQVETWMKDGSLAQRLEQEGQKAREYYGELTARGMTEPEALSLAVRTHNIVYLPGDGLT